MYSSEVLGLHGIVKALVSSAELPEGTTASVSEPVTFFCNEGGKTVKHVGIHVVVKAPHLRENLEVAYVVLNNRN